MTDALVQMDRDQRDGCVILRLRGEIDLSNTERLQQRIELAATGSPLVIIDLSELEYIDSQGLRLLKRLASRLASVQARLELVAPPKSIARDVLDLTLMSGEMTIHDELTR